MYRHFLDDLYKALEEETLVQQRKHDHLSLAAMKGVREGGGGKGRRRVRVHVRAMQARACFGCSAEAYDEQLIACVDGSCNPCVAGDNVCKSTGQDHGRKRKRMMTRIGWSFVVLRANREGKEHGGMEVLWADQGTCENGGIKEEAFHTNVELMAINRLIRLCRSLRGACLTVRGDGTCACGESFLSCDPGGERMWPLVSDTPSDGTRIWTTEPCRIAHVNARNESLWNGVADLQAKGERNAVHYTLARNSFKGPPHQLPVYTSPPADNAMHDTDSDMFTCDIPDMNDDEDVIITRLRPHHSEDGSLSISWQHFLHVRSTLKLGRAVGTDGLNAEFVQCLSMPACVPLWCIFKVTAWASTSPATWTLSPAACLPKDGATLGAERYKVDRLRLVCFDAILVKLLRLAAKLVIEKSRMWPDRPLAIIELDVQKAFDQLHRRTVAPAPVAAGFAPEIALGGWRLIEQGGGIRHDRPESMDLFVFV